jgi:hypothetical protein
MGWTDKDMDRQTRTWTDKHMDRQAYGQTRARDAHTYESKWSKVSMYVSQKGHVRINMGNREHVSTYVSQKEHVRM